MIKTSYTEFTSICERKLRYIHDGGLTISTEAMLDGIEAHQLHQYSDLYPDAEVEDRFEIPFPEKIDGEEILLVGLIDLHRKQKAEIIELKNVYHIGASHVRQARFYGAVMALKYREPYTYTVRALRSNETLSGKISPEEALQYFKKSIKPRLRRLLKVLDTPPEALRITPSTHECPNCPLLDKCRTEKGFPLNELIDKSPQEIAEMYILLRAQYTRLADYLKQYTNVYGNIEVGEYEIGWHPASTTTYSPKLIELLLKSPEGRQFLRADIRRKTELVKAIPMAENFIFTEPTMRFYPKKLDKNE